MRTSWPSQSRAPAALIINLSVFCLLITGNVPDWSFYATELTNLLSSSSDSRLIASVIFKVWPTKPGIFVLAPSVPTNYQNNADQADPPVACSAYRTRPKTETSTQDPSTEPPASQDVPSLGDGGLDNFNNSDTRPMLSYSMLMQLYRRNYDEAQKNISQ
ncbi:Protein of unknown function [Cotesia congregata]|uniref:Uncharacterized protein n=1 Tax=Cotesia congregata TaxID=51543 RepID=A0A8J2EA51_COTCN|nr:Protein of unknown function [Cotesia congregata]